MDVLVARMLGYKWASIGRKIDIWTDRATRVTWQSFHLLSCSLIGRRGTVPFPARFTFLLHACFPLECGVIGVDLRQGVAFALYDNDARFPRLCLRLWYSHASLHPIVAPYLSLYLFAASHRYIRPNPSWRIHQRPYNSTKSARWVMPFFPHSQTCPHPTILIPLR